MVLVKLFIDQLVVVEQEAAWATPRPSGVTSDGSEAAAPHLDPRTATGRSAGTNAPAGRAAASGGAATAQAAAACLAQRWITVAC